MEKEVLAAQISRVASEKYKKQKEGEKNFGVAIIEALNESREVSKDVSLWRDIFLQVCSTRIE